MAWEYRQISVFSHHASAFRIGKNPITLVLFAQSVAFKLDLKERETTNEIKCELEQKQAAAELFPNKSHATANVSLLACKQKATTAALNTYISYILIVKKNALQVEVFIEQSLKVHLGHCSMQTPRKGKNFPPTAQRIQQKTLDLLMQLIDS